MNIQTSRCLAVFTIPTFGLLILGNKSFCFGLVGMTFATTCRCKGTETRQKGHAGLGGLVSASTASSGLPIMAIDTIGSRTTLTVEALLHGGRLFLSRGLHRHAFIVVDIVLSSWHLAGLNECINESIALGQRLDTSQTNSIGYSFVRY